MTLVEDGDSLYGVNYQHATASKGRISDMARFQTVYSGVHPVGLTFDADSGQLCVANWVGTLHVFSDG
ncbi:MAG: hypothetical protein WKF60_11795 [Ilumatobacter sp.]